MRKLITKLADEKDYTFCTLTRRQVSVVQKQQRNSPHSKEMKKLQAKADEDKLTEKEEDRLEELHELEENIILDMIRMSLSKKHPEFAIVEDAKENAKRNEQLQDLIDMRDLQIISDFAISGTVSLEEEAEFNNADIVMVNND
jgi:hypothetical protein